MIADDAYKAFESLPTYDGWPKCDIVSIANQRILDAPQGAQLSRFQPFRKHAGEKNAGVTGQVRREVSPFLRGTVMGIPYNTAPDNDEMTQLLLLVDFLQCQLLGINKPPSFAARTEQQVEEIAAICFEVGQQVVECLDTFVTTKLHRLMRHTKDHFLDYGCFRKGATDANETLHKATKKAYRSTNRHLSNVAPQLLSARTRIEISSEDQELQLGFTMAAPKPLLTRYAVVSAQQSGNEDKTKRTEATERITGLFCATSMI